MRKIKPISYNYKKTEESLNYLKHKSFEHQYIGMYLGFTVRFLDSSADRIRHPRGQRSKFLSLWNKRHEIVSFLELTPIITHNIKGFEASSVGITSNLIGKSFGVKLYKYAIEKLNLPIWSGAEQTPSSRRLWVKLSRIPKISTYILNNNGIEKIKGKEEDRELVGNTIKAYDNKYATRLLAVQSKNVIDINLQKIIASSKLITEITPNNPFSPMEITYKNPKLSKISA